MVDRYDALAVRENNGKSYFTKLGAAFPNKDGKGWTVLLDAMPAAVDGQYKIMLREPLPRDDRERSATNDRQQASDRAQTGRGYRDDEDVPF